MIGRIRNKSKKRRGFFMRKERIEINGSVYIKRPGRPTLMGAKGNISEGGLLVEVPNHDLECGRRVEVIIVFVEDNIRLIKRMMGIVVRIKGESVAMITYKAHDLSPDVYDHDELFRLEFGEPQKQLGA